LVNNKFLDVGTAVLRDKEKPSAGIASVGRTSEKARSQRGDSGCSSDRRGRKTQRAATSTSPEEEKEQIGLKASKGAFRRENE
jgi:hypothetical protein